MHADLGFTQISTYIQSGNAVFTAKKVSAIGIQDEIASQVEAQFGFRPPILLLKREKLEAFVVSNPFPEGVDEPQSLHFFFLEKTPSSPDLETLHQLKTETERFHLDEDIFYLHAPDGIGRSKLASKVEKSLGVVGTGRNYRTVAKLLELVTK